MAGKRALVTGASGGIGQALAVALAKQGYWVTLVARSQEPLDDLVAQLGPEHRTLVADLSDPDGVERVAHELRSRKYGLLVNNAGAGVFGSFDRTPLDKLQRMTRLNCDALVALSHEFLKRATSGDALINVASTLGFLGFPSNALYGASKAMVVSFSEALWFEQKARGVYVMALCPGVTRTNFHRAAGGTAPDEGAQTAEEVAEVALAALKRRRKPTVISGLRNRGIIFAMNRLVSRKRSIKIMGSLSQKAAT
jgi:short-subunit dehydrogenase